MTKEKRRFIVWRVLCVLVRRLFELIFRFSHETYELSSPALIISNHVTNYDPILVGLSFPKNPLGFVASEHLFRLGWLTDLLRWLFDLIARRKGSNGMDTAMACARKIRAGDSILLFGEGETTWDGLSQEIFPATGTLAKICGGELITYRLEGGYLTAPRWGKGIRRGRMHGHIVGRYSPEQLRGMSPAEVTALINRDIHEDCWTRQDAEPVRYRGKNTASQIETALFMCPKCSRIGGLRGKGSRVLCSCGLDVRFTEYGFFEPAEPFRTMAEWDAWQHRELLSRTENLQLEDGTASLSRIDTEHASLPLATDTLLLENGALRCGRYSFPLSEITNMALVQRKILLFSAGDEYYEMRTAEPRCLRKYLALWKHALENSVPRKHA